MKWMSSPSISVMKCGSACSVASHLRQSYSVAQYCARSCSIASGTPCESSGTVSRSGQRVATIRARSASSSLSGTAGIVNGRTAAASTGSLIGTGMRVSFGLRLGRRRGLGRLPTGDRVVGRDEREEDLEDGALARGAMYLDRAPVRGRDGLHNGQAEAEPARLAVAVRAGPGEP